MAKCTSSTAAEATGKSLTTSIYFGITRDNAVQRKSTHITARGQLHDMGTWRMDGWTLCDHHHPVLTHPISFPFVTPKKGETVMVSPWIERDVLIILMCPKQFIYICPDQYFMSQNVSVWTEPSLTESSCLSVLR